MVQRYIEGGYGASEMEEDEQGDWVSYEDYAALRQEMLDINRLYLSELENSRREGERAAKAETEVEHLKTYLRSFR